MYMKNLLLCLLLALCWVPAKAQTGTLQVWMDDIEMTADGESIAILSVYERDTASYTAFNFSLLVPPGIKLAMRKVGRETTEWIELSERAADHDIACNQVDTSTIKVIAYSMTLSDFYPDDENGDSLDLICRIGLIADPEMYNGRYTIEMNPCKFVKEDVDASVPEYTIKARLTVTGGKDPMGVDYTLSDAGYGTLILPFDAELPTGLQAYTCTSTLGNDVLLSRQEKIEANKPVLIVGTPGNYTFDGINLWNEDSYSEGLLTGVFVSTDITSGYVLQTHGDITAFYRVDSDKPTTISPNHCYLTLGNGPQRINLKVENVTGLDSVTQDDQAVPTYDLNGRKTNVQQQGPFIRNNKKQIRK
jgi:hypothetical protein